MIPFLYKRLEQGKLVRSLSCIVSALRRLYVDSYIYHFKKGIVTVPKNVELEFVSIRNMTNFEISDTRYFRQFSL